MKHKISAIIIAWNEEKQIRACLESLKDAVAEIIFVHDGFCRDRTIDIAKEYTNNVFIKKSPGGSSEFIRPFAISKASGDWILHIDADERLSSQLASRLSKLVTSPKIDAYSFRWPFYDEHGNRIEQYMPKFKKVLFRRSKIYHLGMPHLGSETYGVHRNCNYILEHHFKSESARKHKLANDFRKNQVRARTAVLLLSNPNQISTYNCSLSHYPGINGITLWFIRRLPFPTILFLPLMSFFYRYLIKRYFMEGSLGFTTSLNVPTYYFFICYYRLTSFVNVFLK